MGNVYGTPARLGCQRYSTACHAQIYLHPMGSRFQVFASCRFGARSSCLGLLIRESPPLLARRFALTAGTYNRITLLLMSAAASQSCMAATGAHSCADLPHSVGNEQRRYCTLQIRSWIGYWRVRGLDYQGQRRYRCDAERKHTKSIPNIPRANGQLHALCQSFLRPE